MEALSGRYEDATARLRTGANAARTPRPPYDSIHLLVRIAIELRDGLLPAILVDEVLPRPAADSWARGV